MTRRIVTLLPDKPDMQTGANLADSSPVTKRLGLRPGLDPFQVRVARVSCADR